MIPRANRATYAAKALSQVPRLLGNQDRSPFSPTYGCCHRDYWLDKTSDFPDAVRQFGIHALALAYRVACPGNIYFGQPKIRDWATAGLDFWARIQHRDGSFDEFYPYERGWVGPTAFTTYSSIETFNLLASEIPPDVAVRARHAIRKAAYFVAAGEAEEDHLANHHAMACLAVWKAYRLLGEDALLAAYHRSWKTFLSYHNPAEGWSREYDGPDPGYLSATVSFLGKIYQDSGDPELLEVLRQSVEFCAIFAYPNGYYAGSTGSRNTLHFYPHGFEVLAPRLPLAAAVAERMLAALEAGCLVPPEIISDRYVVYRVPEFLLAYADYAERPRELEPLPYQRGPFRKYFDLARVYVANDADRYVVANLGKGGVVKVFSKRDGRLLASDCGLVGRLDDGRVVTSQWVDPAYECRIHDDGWEVEGHLHVVPSNKVFSPAKQLLFRFVLVLLGWSPRFSHALKGRIRKALILGQRTVPVRFRRRVRSEGSALRVTDEVRSEGGPKVASLAAGDEFFVRFVPQSRYFQSQELDVSGVSFTASDLAVLAREGAVTITRSLGARTPADGA